MHAKALSNDLVSFAERLARRISLTPAERAFLAGLESRRVRYGRHETIVRSGEPAGEAFVLQSGWVMSYSQFRDGGRQVRRLHFPGDLVAMPSVPLQRHAEDIETLSEAVVSPFDKRLLARLFDHPRLAAIMYMFAQAERITSGDRLCCLSRLPAKARMAFLVVDILQRLRAADASTGSSFRMQITREQMADVTGMTAVHASRMWSALLTDGSIRCDGSIVTVVEEERLRRLSGYVDRSRELDFGWLASVAGPAPEAAAHLVAAIR
jgi:CRP-like cAMP-binding protein